MALPRWERGCAKRSLEPGGGQPDLFAQGNRFAVAGPADVCRCPVIRTPVQVRVSDVSNAVVQRCVDAQN